jgi:hypothetical protein
MSEQMQVCPPFPDRVREMMREYLETVGAPDDHLDLLVWAYTRLWREAWRTAQQYPCVARIRAEQGSRWKRALYECALEAME